MEFSALDPVKIIALMSAGGLFALAGLWLMFRPKMDGHAAKIELFGLKFESSSAGLLVFVIGAAFLASPLFVQERNAGVSAGAVAPGPAGSDTGAVAGGDVASGTAQVAVSSPDPAVVGTTAPALIATEGREVEPNETPASGNVIPIGAVITGTLDPESPDHFQVPIAQPENGEIVIAVTGEHIRFRVFDDLGESIYQVDLIGNTSKAFRGKLDQTRYYIQLETGYGDDARPYQMTVAARRAE